MNNKLKKILWFAFFLSWGQYFSQGRWRAFLRTNFFFSAIWIIGAGIFMKDLLPSASTMSFPFFVLGVQCIIALCEKYYPEWNIGYDMADVLPVSKYGVLLLRLIARNVSPSNIICLSVSFLNFYLRGNTLFFSIVCTSCVFFLSTILTEVFAFLSFYTSGFRPEHIFLWLNATEFIRLAFSVYIPDSALSVILLIIALIGVFLTVVLVGLLKLKRINIKIKLNFISKRTGSNRKLKRSLLLAQRNITPYRMLLLRDYVLLFKYRPSLIVIGVLLVGNMFSNGDKIYYVDSVFYILGFVVAYGMNYFGVENQNFLLVLTSALPHKILLQSKFISFAIVAFCGVVVVSFFQVLIFHVSVLEVIWSIVAALFVIALYGPFIHFCSIQYYVVDKTKNKQPFVRSMLVCISAIVVFLPFLYIKFSNNYFINLFVVCLMIGLGLVSLLFIHRKHNRLSERLSQKRPSILEDLSNY